MEPEFPKVSIANPESTSQPQQETKLPTYFCSQENTSTVLLLDHYKMCFNKTDSDPVCYDVLEAPGFSVDFTKTLERWGYSNTHTLTMNGRGLYFVMGDAQTGQAFQESVYAYLDPTQNGISSYDITDHICEALSVAELNEEPEQTTTKPEDNQTAVAKKSDHISSTTLFEPVAIAD